MNELKAYRLWPDEVKPGVNLGSDYYLKSEADKVIAELIEKNKRLANINIIKASETIKDLYKELRHHKYKRCLAVARWCHNESLWWYSKGYGFEKYDKFWEKWEKRWRELAEKFKEGK